MLHDAVSCRVWVNGCAVHLKAWVIVCQQLAFHLLSAGVAAAGSRLRLDVTVVNTSCRNNCDCTVGSSRSM